MNDTGNSPAAAIALLSQHASNVWRLYQEQGAGNLDPDLAAPLEAAFASVEKHRDAIDEEWLQAAKTAFEISLRCINRSEGLNFVTGEAGMIPRRDLIEPFVAALHRLDPSRS